MRKRNKLALLLILPIAVFIWFVGWSLYWSGYRGNVTETNKATNTGLTFAVLMPEQKYAT